MRLATLQAQLWTSARCYDMAKCAAVTALNIARYVEIYLVLNQTNANMFRKSRRLKFNSERLRFPGGGYCRLE